MAIDVARASAQRGDAPAVVALRPGAERREHDRAPARWTTPLAERADVAPLQRLVDALAGALGRPVLLDDADLRLLAHSQQGDHEIDRVRLISILQRQAPADV